MRGPLRLLLLVAAVTASSSSARGQVVVKPRVLVIIDTSGSMLQHFENNVGCGGDGDADSSYRDGFVGPNAWYPGNDGWSSRLYAAKHALIDVINATGDLDFGLERYALDANCVDKKNCCTFANPRCVNNNGYIDGPVTYRSSCGPVQNGVAVDGGQILTRPAATPGGLGPAGNLASLQWVDGIEDFRDRGDGWPINGELRAGTGTPLAGAIRTALNGWYAPVFEVSKQGSPSYDPNSPLFDPVLDCRPYVMVAMTDGADTCDNDRINGPPGAVAALFARNQANAVKTYVIGLAFRNGDPAIGVLNNMALSGGSGVARFANNQTEIAAAFADIAASSIKVELCNGIDDNCNALADEGFDKGNRCTAGVGACARSGIKKCDPNNNTQTTCCVDDGQPDGACMVVAPAPAGIESCNGLDDDCNGVTDDPPVCQIQQCFTETCNGLDDDCDGLIDNHLVDTGKTCGLSAGSCRQGTTTCLNLAGGDVGAGAPAGPGDRLVCAGGVEPRPETCNGFDDDCDGVMDGVSRACYAGPPGTDGVAACHGGFQPCAAVPGSGMAAWGQCLGQQLPAAETCNGRDDDCDGKNDNVVSAGAPCCPSGLCGTGACVAGSLQCSGNLLVCAGGQGPTSELCNALDDDCDGLVDNLPGLGNPCQPPGGGCAGALRCDLQRRQQVCVPGAAAPEICNGLDDNCDGRVDEESALAGSDPRIGLPCGPGNMLSRPCMAGATTCKAAEVVCSGGTPPAVEICDCIDNDCNGRLDDSALCPAGTACRSCGCYEPCQPGEFPCPGGFDCVEQFCLPHADCNPPCPGEFTCVGRTCIDRCAGLQCPAGHRCDHGTCVDDSCATRDTCAACDGSTGQRCDAAKRACVPDLCCGKKCGATEFCEPADGACNATCTGKECPDGETCIQGQCFGPKCTGAMCREIEVCDPRSGQCQPDLCGVVSCVPGFTCCGGMCQQDLCPLVKCPAGYKCTTNKLDCTHSCDTLILPTEQQDVVVAAGGGSRMALKRLTHAVSSCTRSTPSILRSSADSVSTCAESRNSAAGRTTNACGSGLSLSASSASPKPLFLRNSASASSACTSVTSSTSRRCAMRFSACRACSSEAAGFMYTEMSSALPQPPLATRTFCTSTCRQAGSARAMPITRTVSSDANGCVHRRPSEPTSVCR